MGELRVLIDEFNSKGITHAPPITPKVACALAIIGAGGVLFTRPLNPPSGAVNSTGKTLTEVEPRIAINAIDTPGDNDATPPSAASPRPTPPAAPTPMPTSRTEPAPASHPHPSTPHHPEPGTTGGPRKDAELRNGAHLAVRAIVKL